MAQVRGERVNKKQLARLFGSTPYEIDQWIAMGCPVEQPGDAKGKPWEFDTAQVARWLRASFTPADDGDSLDLQEQRARLAKEQADHHALKNAQLRNELLPAGEVIQGWEDAIARAKTLLLAIPRGVAEECVILAPEGPVAIETLLSERIRDALEELSRTEVDDDEFGDEDGSDEGDLDVGAAAEDEPE